MMSWFYNPLILSAVVGLAVFVCSYRFSDQILEFVSKKILGSQKEILEIMDRLLITQKKEIIVRNCWILSISLSLVVFLLLWPNVFDERPSWLGGFGADLDGHQRRFAVSLGIPLQQGGGTACGGPDHHVQQLEGGVGSYSIHGQGG